MATTPNYNLPLIPDNAVNNIKRDFNLLSEAVDSAMKTAVEGVDIPLSDATNGTRSNVAGSEKAVGLVMQAANAANLAAATAQSKADQAETQAGAQAKINAAVGSLPSLLTSAKGNTVAAINELFTSASNGKTAVAAAITGKGVPASGSDTFPVLAQKIGQIFQGKKYAEGTTTFNYQSPQILVANAYDFKASTIIFTMEDTTNGTMRYGLFSIHLNINKVFFYELRNNILTQTNGVITSNNNGFTSGGPSGFVGSLVNWMALG